jgi:hypothetical protein
MAQGRHHAQPTFSETLPALDTAEEETHMIKAYREWLLSLSNRKWELIVLVVHPIVIAVVINVATLILKRVFTH